MIATKPVDFRKGAEGLAALVRDTMKSDPFSGAIYVFRVKRANSTPIGIRYSRRLPWAVSHTRSHRSSDGRSVRVRLHLPTAPGSAPCYVEGSAPSTPPDLANPTSGEKKDKI
ncbi:IS66 family insertion sequence element accessory protein TnpB [Bradyrhizobium sp. 150]|uniref:IS66 family insertion sequence element accessory protein TnpB n=1 Tax=Bradyrhizobium sp. 150 TaxID=2782625 RepID=UPI001FFB4AB6|nr:IS66 family insertion sequence element accessory protein TnpB [Bradyrhizobium sp. 150]MCK1676400.1 IS66 family insertion sequence element accessory protein TnpB [Bradyrhizobium sp. 150]